TSGADSPCVMAVDVNNDGRSDLLVTHQIAAWTAPVVVSQKLSVLLGNGNGTFQTAREIGFGTGMARLAGGRLHHDGRKDLGFTGDTGRAYVLLGTGDGSFVQQTVTLVSQNNLGVDATDVGVADLNRDGLQDLVVVIGLNGSRMAVLIGNGDGTFRTALL